MVRLRCQRCGHEWNYTGDSEYRTTCPSCNTTVTIPKAKTDDS